MPAYGGAGRRGGGGGRKGGGPGGLGYGANRMTSSQLRSTQFLSNVSQHSSRWAMLTLVSKKARPEGVAVQMLDTIMYESDLPSKWLFTSSKTGAVLKKKQNAITGTALLDRFMELASPSPFGPPKRGIAAFAAATEEEPPQFVALQRNSEGHIALMTREALEEVAQHLDMPSVNTVALSALVPLRGSAGTIYRNEYRVTNALGHCVRTTLSYTTILPEPEHVPGRSGGVGGGGGGTAPAVHGGVLHFNPETAHMYRSNASVLNRQLNAATAEVVAHLEAEGHMRVLQLWAEYVVDEFSNLWLVWISPVKYTTGEAAGDLRNLVDIAQGDTIQRASWIGRDALDVLEHERTWRSNHPVTVSTDYAADRPFSPICHRQLPDVRSSDKELRVASAQLEGAAMRVEIRDKEDADDDDAAAMTAAVRERQKKIDGEGGADDHQGTNHGAAMGTESETPAADAAVAAAAQRAAAPRRRHGGRLRKDKDKPYMLAGVASAPVDRREVFPSPFACDGDYCNVDIVETSHLRSKGKAKSNAPTRLNSSSGDSVGAPPSESDAGAGAGGGVVQQTLSYLFSDEDLEKLRSDPIFMDILRARRDKFQFASITRKSIVLAREDKKQVAKDLAAKAKQTGGSITEDLSWQHYPESPRVKARKKREELEARRAARQRNPEMAHAQEQWKRRRAALQLAEGPSMSTMELAELEPDAMERATGDTTSSAWRQQWSQQRGALKQGAAVYYSRVPVCGNCFRIYSLLDRSRRVMQMEREKEERFKRLRRASTAGTDRDELSTSQTDRSVS